MSYVPALNLYGMLNDIGDNILEGQKRQREQELEDKERAEASAKFGIDISRPKQEGFLQKLTRTITGEPEPQTPTINNSGGNSGGFSVAPAEPHLNAPAQQAPGLPMLASTPAIVAEELKKRGHSPVAIAGILGNLKAESGFNPSIMGDNGTSGGLAQWHNERLSALKQFAAQQGTDWRDPRIQAAYLDYELKNKEPRAYAALQAAQTPEEAATGFLGFERPQGWSAANPMGAMGAQQRVNNAVQLAGALPASTGAKFSYSPPATAQTGEEWPASVRKLGFGSMPEIMAAMDNRFMKPFAMKALEIYGREASKDTGKYTTLTTPEQRSQYGIPETDTGVWQVDSHGRLVQSGSRSGAGQPHVVGNALVGPDGKVLYQAPQTAASLSKEAIDLAADRSIAGDDSWKTGLGKGAQGAENLTAVQNRVAEKLKERGADADTILNNVAKFGGQKAGARKAGQMAATLDILGSTVARAADIATKLSYEFPRGSFVPLNKLEQMGASAMSDPKLAAFKAATNTLVTEYAKAIGGGVGTDTSREHAREMLSTAQSPEAFAAVTNILNREIEAAHSAAKDRLNAGTGEGAHQAEKPSVTKRFIYDANGNLKSE